MGYKLGEITDAQIQFLRDEKDEEERQLYEEERQLYEEERQLYEEDKNDPRDMDVEMPLSKDDLIDLDDFPECV